MTTRVNLDLPGPPEGEVLVVMLKTHEGHYAYAHTMASEQLLSQHPQKAGEILMAELQTAFVILERDTP